MVAQTNTGHPRRWLILGVLVIGVVNNGIVLLGIQSFWQDVVRSTLLIVAVAIDQLRLRLTGE